ncbi:MAG: hypothetical protein V1816_21975 [Pseudomonadota bacterium]
MTKRYQVKAECPECGCGLIDGLTPDQFREKYGETKKQIEVVCPDCGKTHLAEVTEEEE